MSFQCSSDMMWVGVKNDQCNLQKMALDTNNFFRQNSLISPTWIFPLLKLSPSPRA